MHTCEKSHKCRFYNESYTKLSHLVEHEKSHIEND